MDKVYIVESYYAIPSLLQYPKIEGVFSSKELAEQYILNQEITVYYYKQKDNHYVYDVRPWNLKIYCTLGYKKSKKDTLIETRKCTPTLLNSKEYKYPIHMPNNFLDYDNIKIYRIIVESIDKSI